MESPADDTVLIPKTLMIIYLLIAILSASFSSYVQLVYLLIFSNFVNALSKKLHNFTVIFNFFLWLTNGTELQIHSKIKFLKVGISIKPRHKLPVSRMLLTKITLNNFLAIVCFEMLFSIELDEGKI